MHRWTARFLLLVMLVPAIGPLALARVAPPEAMHCTRRPLQATSAARPAMHCHHAAAAAETAAERTSQPETSEATLRSLNCCCPNHDCCRGLKTSEWARPVHFLSVASFPVEPAIAAQIATRVSAALTGPDSARAPPRS